MKKTAISPPKKVPSPTQCLGTFAEDVVAFWYEQLGYSILCRNYRCRRGELDIVAKQGNSWMFVEVRGGRCHKNAQSAIASVQRNKQQKLWYTIFHYLAQRQDQDLAEIQLDVVGVAVDRQGSLELCRVTYEP